MNKDIIYLHFTYLNGGKLLPQIRFYFGQSCKFSRNRARGENFADIDVFLPIAKPSCALEVCVHIATVFCPSREIGSNKAREGYSSLEQISANIDFVLPQPFICLCNLSCGIFKDQIYTFNYLGPDYFP